LIESSNPNSEKLVEIYSSLASCYHSLGKIDEALEYYNKTSVLVPDNSTNLAIIYNSIGSCYAITGDHERALEYYSKCRDIWHLTLPSNDPDLAMIYSNIGLCLNSLGRNEEALEFYEVSKQIKELILPKNHPELCTLYNNIGICYDDMGNSEQAIKFYEKCKDIWEETQSNLNDLAMLYSNMGNCYMALNKFKQALLFLDKCRVIWENEQRDEVADTYFAIGMVWYEMKNFEEAKGFFKKAKKIRRKLGEESSEYLCCLNYIGNCFYEDGIYSKALKYFRMLKSQVETTSETEIDLAEISIRICDCEEQVLGATKNEDYN
jgi:tetratricopeptide (TPR) repeat protein